METKKEVTTSLDNNYEQQISKLIQTAGKLDLTNKEKEALYAEISDDEILIKRDGTIYAPWTVYVKRLNDAFSGTGWALVPQGNPIVKRGGILWGFHLIIRGHYCGFDFGQAEDMGSPESFKDFGNTIQAAKSNALMRICKELGIGLKLWDKAFVQKWMEAYAYQQNGEWFKGTRPEQPSPSTRRVGVDFDAINALEAKLAPHTTEEALKKEWAQLDTKLQSNAAIFRIFKKHISRVKALPPQKIYQAESTSQQQAIKDYEKMAAGYTTAVEIEQNLEHDKKLFIARGLLPENASGIALVAARLAIEKRQALKPKSKAA